MKPARLIYDVGMHLGEDSAYYLKRGFNVIGFEADPDLLEHCRKRFAGEIEAGRFKLVPGAVVAPQQMPAGNVKVIFHRCANKSVWGTVSEERAKRNIRLGEQLKPTAVDAVDFCDCLRQHGVPYYMKVDIEGLEPACLSALRNSPARPAFVSTESDLASFHNITQELCLLEELGYDRFQVVPQRDVPHQVVPNPSLEGPYAEHVFSPGSSGLFGDDLRGAWRTKEEALAYYRKLCALYRFFGERSSPQRARVARSSLRLLARWAAVLRANLPRQLRRALLELLDPGWYDTHARHSSIIPVPL